MFPLSEAIGPLAWTQFWQVTLVAVCVGLVARCGCRRRPHLAYLLWLVVILKCLTPPLWSSPTGLFSWTARINAAGTEAPRPDFVATGAVAAPTESPERQGASGGTKPIAGVAETSARVAPLAGADTPEGASPDPAPAGTPVSLRVFLGLVWLAGAAAQAGLALWTVAAWWRTIRRSQLPVEPRLATLVEQLVERLGIARHVRLIVTGEPLGPVTYGWLRPTIVLPGALVAARSTDELKPLVAHELIHVRRGDALVGLLQLVVQSLWWFHPLVWWANRRMVFERERCCDEEVLAALDVSPSRYADGLLRVLELKHSLRTPAALPGIRRLEITRQRLEHLLGGGRFQKRTPRGYWLILTAAALLLMPGAGLRGSAEPDAVKPADDGGKAEAEAATVKLPKQPTGESAPDADPRVAPAADLQIHLTDVRQTAGKDPGSIVWSFTVAEPVGTQFQIDYLQPGVRGANGAGFGIFTTASDRAEVELTLEYRPDFAGDRNIDVLHSREALLTLRVDAKGTNLPGMVTTASAPLLTVAPDDREITLVKQDVDTGAVTRFGGRRILLAFPKSEAGQSAESMKIRSEIDVSRYEKTPPAPALSAADRLKKAWARQEHEIGSAHIEYRLVRAAESQLKPLGRDEVNRILAAADLDKHPENFASAAAKLMLPEVLKGSTEAVGGKGEFFSAGLNRRDQDTPHARVDDGELDLMYTPANRQVDVFASGKSKRAQTRINDFRIQFNPAMLASFELTERPDGKIRLWKKTDDSQGEWIVDAETGFIERVSGQRPIETSDRFQYAPVRHPGGIVMPTVKIGTRYRDGVLAFLEIWKVDKAQFNDAVPEGTFHLAAPAGTNLFIYGSDPAAPPKSTQLKEDTADVAGYLRGRSDLVPELKMNWPNPVKVIRARED